MLRAATTATKASCAALGVALAILAGLVLGLRSVPARAVSIGQLQQEIGAGRSRISSLAGVVGAYSSQLARLDASITSLQNQISTLEADLAVKEAELIRLKIELTLAHNRLVQLEAFEAHAESVLAMQLVNTYESDQPDLVTVVLEANGFQDLLERLSFAQRIQRQDVEVIKAVRTARRQVAAEAIHLGALEVRQQALTTQILDERNALAETQTTLIRRRIPLAQARGVKAGQLAAVRGQVASLEQQLVQAEAAQAAAAARAAAQAAAARAAPSPGSGSGSAAPGPAAPAPASGGGFVFPLPRGSASPPGSWSQDQGVDISAPGGTPEYAVCSGTIVLHGIGGFGPWAPVLHCDSPIDGYSYVYYGHAGPANQLPVGTHVGAGAVMSSIGPGIVGISTGPHIEIGFADSSGSPNGGGSGAMLSLLQGSY
jgi:murein DD-endopeptidase MepM/ murein hydrolase activator NlpD